MQNFWGPLLPKGLDKELTESAGSVHIIWVWPVCVCDTYELSETSDWQPTSSSNKLEQAYSLLIVHLLHHLQRQISL